MKKTVKGSYTVEIAFVFPIVLFVIVGLIYLGFYMHDKDKIEAVINETLIKGRNLLQNETDMNTGLIDYEAYYKRGILYSLEDNLQEKKEEIYNYIQTQLGKGLFIADINAIDVNVSHTQISIEVKAEMKLPFLGIRPFFAGSGTSVIEKTAVPIQNNTEFIRIFNIFSSVAGKIPVIDETLKKLQQILNKL
jgi:hypothetical protein